MTDAGPQPLIVNLTEQFNRRFYVLYKNNSYGLEVFRILYNGTQSYYTFTRNCDLRQMSKMSSLCFMIEMDNRQVAIVQDCEIPSIGNVNVTLVENPSDPASPTTIYLMPKIDIKRFMFPIFAIEQIKKRLIAQVNAIPPNSSKLPIPDAYTFNVDISEEINNKETELALIFSVIIDEMRHYMPNDDDNKEDFYDNN